MSSSLYYVTLDEINTIMPEIMDSGFVGSIDYSDIHSEDEYLNAMGTIFRFPLFDGQTGHSWNGYFDWMTDLFWENDDEWMQITKKGYNLIIYNCDTNGYADRYDDLLKKSLIALYMTFFRGGIRILLIMLLKVNLSLSMFI